MEEKNKVQHVYLVGAKSLGAYGGYETFILFPESVILVISWMLIMKMIMELVYL